MGVSTGGAVGQVRGKVGNVVFSAVRGGIQIVKAYQPNVRNPNAEKQKVQRSRQGQMGRIAHDIGRLLRKDFGAAPAKFSGSNAMIYYSYRNDVFPTPDSPTIDYSALVVARNLDKIQVAEVLANGTANTSTVEVTVTLMNTNIPSSVPTGGDIVVYCYNPNTGFAATLSNSYVSGIGTVFTFTGVTAVAGDEVLYWAQYVRPDNDKVVTVSETANIVTMS